MKSIAITPLDTDSIYNRLPRVYAFFREWCFRDDTNKITDAVWPNSIPPNDSRVLEMGCGPGFYSLRLAARYRRVDVHGIDLAERLISLASQEARRLNLENCRFTCADVQQASVESDSIAAVIISRLLLIVTDRKRALAEAHRVLRPDGVCFIAEPRGHWRAGLPFKVMWGLAQLREFFRLYPGRGTSRDLAPRVLTSEEFSSLVDSQPWGKVRTWNDGDYQYAVCWKSDSFDPVI